MFFVLSKTLAIVLLPSNLLILLAVAGVVLMLTRWRRVGLRLTVAALTIVVAVSLLPVGSFLIHTLEQRFPRWDPARGAPDGIVVLGGGLSPSLSHAHGTPVVNADADRIIAIARLARDYPDARIIYSGGDGRLIPAGYAETEFLGPLLDQMGVPRERVVLESRSRNTTENAVFSKALAQPKPGERWLLVTTAWHMPRAVGCFRRAGFAVEAYPVGWRTGTRFVLRPRSNISGGLASLDLAVHEWTGLIAYWLAGRTSELLPGA